MSKGAARVVVRIGILLLVGIILVGLLIHFGSSIANTVAPCGAGALGRTGAARRGVGAREAGCLARRHPGVGAGAAARAADLADLARHHSSSVRTVIRRFQAETGLAPLQWLLNQRIDRARELLETTDLPLDRIAERSGIGSVDSLRQHLVRRCGLTPSAYRASYARTATNR